MSVTFGVVQKADPDDFKNSETLYECFFTLNEGRECSIGRGHQADLCIPDDFTSKVHCKVWIRDGECHVMDMESKNGTSLNEVIVTQSRFYIRDFIRIGNTFIFIDHNQTSAQFLQTLAPTNKTSPYPPY